MKGRFERWMKLCTPEALTWVGLVLLGIALLVGFGKMFGILR